MVHWIFKNGVCGLVWGLCGKVKDAADGPEWRGCLRLAMGYQLGDPLELTRPTAIPRPRHIPYRIKKAAGAALRRHARAGAHVFLPVLQMH